MRASSADDQEYSIALGLDAFKYTLHIHKAFYYKLSRLSGPNIAYCP